jgi:hypothetical protein
MRQLAADAVRTRQEIQVTPKDFFWTLGSYDVVAIFVHPTIVQPALDWPLVPPVMSAPDLAGLLQGRNERVLASSRGDCRAPHRQIALCPKSSLLSGGRRSADASDAAFAVIVCIDGRFGSARRRSGAILPGISTCR